VNGNGNGDGRSWMWPGELLALGILGINRRNIEYLNELNPRTHYPLVDDKVLTKGVCERHGVPVPETYAVLEYLGDLRYLEERLGGRCEFVVKPSRGAAGRGVLVVSGRAGDDYLTAGSGPLTQAALRHHISSILSGLYSIGGRPDRAIIEERIRPHECFARAAPLGTPDIRVIICRDEPVMAMLRLPTIESRGRANLHQGAIAAGIDLGSGVTSGGVSHNRVVDLHPDTGAPVAGITVPSWNAVLDTAVCLARSLGLGFVGVDIVLDAARGPVVLEANARPGLSIQIANGRGLLRALGA